MPALGPNPKKCRQLTNDYTQIKLTTFKASFGALERKLNCEKPNRKSLASLMGHPFRYFHWKIRQLEALGPTGSSDSITYFGTAKRSKAAGIPARNAMPLAITDFFFWLTTMAMYSVHPHGQKVCTGEQHL